MMQTRSGFRLISCNMFVLWQESGRGRTLSILSCNEYIGRVTKLARDEMRLVGYVGSIPVIDVCNE